MRDTSKHTIHNTHTTHTGVTGRSRQPGTTHTHAHRAFDREGMLGTFAALLEHTAGELEDPVMLGEPASVALSICAF